MSACNHRQGTDIRFYLYTPDSRRSWSDYVKTLLPQPVNRSSHYPTPVLVAQVLMQDRWGGTCKVTGPTINPARETAAPLSADRSSTALGGSAFTDSHGILLHRWQNHASQSGSSAHQKWPNKHLTEQEKLKKKGKHS